MISSVSTTQQALESGLLDEVCVSLVPVLFGEGIPYFAKLSGSTRQAGQRLCPGAVTRNDSSMSSPTSTQSVLSSRVDAGPSGRSEVRRQVGAGPLAKRVPPERVRLHDQGLRMHDRLAIDLDRAGVVGEQLLGEEHTGCPCTMLSCASGSANAISRTRRESGRHHRT